MCTPLLPAILFGIRNPKVAPLHFAPATNRSPGAQITGRDLDNLHETFTGFRVVGPAEARSLIAGA